MTIQEGETYLGDGLYASYQDHIVKVRTPRLGGDHEVYFEMETLMNFLDWVKDLKVDR